MPPRSFAPGRIGYSARLVIHADLCFFAFAISLLSQLYFVSFWLGIAIPGTTGCPHHTFIAMNRGLEPATPGRTVSSGWRSSDQAGGLVNGSRNRPPISSTVSAEQSIAVRIFPPLVLRKCVTSRGGFLPLSPEPDAQIGLEWVDAIVGDDRMTGM